MSKNVFGPKMPKYGKSSPDPQKLNIFIYLFKLNIFIYSCFRNYLNKINCSKSFFLNATWPLEIDKMKDTLDINKSTGPNSIPVYILKIFKSFFTNWLSKIINLTFEVSIFPDILKIAKIVPIHKKGSKLDHVNYRPISLSSVFSKIFEKVLYKRMYSFLKSNLVLNPIIQLIMH